MTLICLISGQLQPNLFSLILLKPQKVVLICTVDTKESAVHFEQVIRAHQYGTQDITIIPTDPFNFKKIRVTASELADKLEQDESIKHDEIVLNRTAGTKPMAFEFSNMFAERGWAQIYFDSQNEICWWQRKGEIVAEPHEIKLNVFDYLASNGVNVVSYTEKVTLQHLLPLANYIWKQKKGLSNPKFKNWFSKFKKASIKPDEIPDLDDGLLKISKKYRFNQRNENELYIEVIYKDTLLPETNPKFWANWFVGGWLEYKLFEIMKTCGDYDDVQCNVKLGPTKSSEKAFINEIDIIAIKNGIPVFVECKTGKVEQKHITNLQSLSQMYGGTYSQLVLATLIPISSDAFKQKIAKFKIELLVGFDSILKGIRELHEVMVIRT